MRESEVVDKTHLWAKYPVELDGWVLAHRMLEQEQALLKTFVKALCSQVRAGINLTQKQRSTVGLCFDRYFHMLHHHHFNEDEIAFPYLTQVKKVKICEKATADHAELCRIMDSCQNIANTIATSSDQLDNVILQLEELSTMFASLDAALVEHYREEEAVIIPAMRRVVTPKEMARHLTKPIVGSMDWADRGQFFGKMNHDQLKAFMKQEGIPFFAKWIFNRNIRSYNKAYVRPMEEAMDYANKSMQTKAMD